MDKKRDPEYWRKWRQAHPDYRARERARSKARPRGWTPRERETQRLRRQRQRADNGWVVTTHPIMDEAATVAGRYVHPDRRTLYNDAIYEEALMTAALAILEGADPHEAVKAIVNRERLWRWYAQPSTDLRQ